MQGNGREIGGGFDSSVDVDGADSPWLTVLLGPLYTFCVTRTHASTSVAEVVIPESLEPRDDPG